VGKNLDQELADAIKATGDDDDVAGAVAKPVAAPKRGPKKNLAMLLTLLAMVGALMVFFFVGLKPAAVYAVPVEQLVDKPADYTGRKVRIEGNLVPGTLEKRDQPCEYRFRVSSSATAGKQLPVTYATCVVPDTFRDRPEGGVEVTIEGSLAKGGASFEATQLMAKCASKYDPKEHKMKPDDGKVSARE
jgi:cytochrome c-type biogenesis protein CcmE